MANSIRRRDAITLLASAAAMPIAWPLAARSQQQRTVPVVGFLSSATERLDEVEVQSAAGFRRGLGEQGFVAGRNVEILYLWANMQYDRMPALAAEFVRRPVNAIFAASAAAAIAAKSATATIPIVFVMADDPVANGIVPSLNRPGGNITGTTARGIELVAKRLELLHEVVRAVTSIGLVVNPANPQAAAEIKEAEVAARGLGVHLVVLSASSPRDFGAIFATLAERRIGALMAGFDPIFAAQDQLFIKLAAQYSVPTIHQFREGAAAGGLMSYGPDWPDAWRLAGTYVGRILKGDKPSDLPVQLSTRFEMVLNLKVAKALGIDVPTATLLRATEVIE